MEIVTPELCWKAQQYGACSKVPSPGTRVEALSFNDLLWAHNAGIVEQQAVPIWALSTVGDGYGDGVGIGVGVGNGLQLIGLVL